MWEAIESNKRRSWALVAIMAILLLGLGAAIGGAVDPAAWWIGAACAAVVFAAMFATAWIGGDKILLHGVGGRRIHSKAEIPRLWNVVEEMTIAAGVPSMPEIWLIEDKRPNAFATGKSVETGAVAVTSGLLSRMNRDELQGVVAHEMGHIVNRDIRFMTLAGIMVGSIVLLSEVFLRYMWFSGGGHARRRTGKNVDGRLQAVLMIAGIVAALLAPVLARLLYFACSRRREYLADASAARFTRYPEGLASALEKISSRYGGSAKKRHGRDESSRVLAPMYIINPMQAHGSTGIFSTHPPTQKRIEVLRNMAGAGGAHFAAYESAYQRVFGKDQRCLGEVTLTEGRRPLEIRDPAPKSEAESATDRLREVTDLLDRMGEFVAFHCLCGVGIKVPPGLHASKVACPRCGREQGVPTASVVTAEQPEAELKYQRKSEAWESFRCPHCDKTTHLSPALEAPRIRCSGCRRKIEILPATGERAATETPNP